MQPWFLNWIKYVYSLRHRTIFLSVHFLSHSLAHPVNHSSLTGKMRLFANFLFHLNTAAAATKHATNTALTPALTHVAKEHTHTLLDTYITFPVVQSPFKWHTSIGQQFQSKNYIILRSIFVCKKLRSLGASLNKKICFLVNTTKHTVKLLRTKWSRRRWRRLLRRSKPPQRYSSTGAAAALFRGTAIALRIGGQQQGLWWA